MNTIILIPPSEGKNEGGSGRLTKLHPITQTLLKEIPKQDPAKLYGVKSKALEAAIAMNKNIKSAPCLKAIERYKGVVYKAIDYTGCKHLDRLRIVSGLFGLLKYDDKIPNYKLKIDKLGADKLWREENAKQLKGFFVIDLLPQAHHKAVEYDDGIRVDFILEKNGKKMPAGHQGKHIKGRFIRWLLNNNVIDPKDFSKFKEEDYLWDGNNFKKSI